MPNPLQARIIVRSAIDAMMPNYSYSKVLTEGDIGIDTATPLKIRPITLTEGAIGIDTIIRATVQVLTEGAIGVDSILRAGVRVLTEGAIGVDSVVRSTVKVLTDGMIGIDTIRKTVNGLTVIWSHITRASAATFTKITKASTSWTHIDQS